jgi:hypothetical protein
MKEVFQGGNQMVGVLELDDMGPIGFKVLRAPGLGLDSSMHWNHKTFFFLARTAFRILSMLAGRYMIRPFDCQDNAEREELQARRQK